VVPWLVVIPAIMVGEFAVWTLGLGESTGGPLFLLLLGTASMVYAAVIHVAIRFIGSRVELPWLVWPALLVAPVVSILLTMPLADPLGVMETPTAVPALAGLTIAFVTLGKRRWTKSG
jgi:uncharacterized membrane-anchored protein